jgi:hypothetical protein
LLGFCCRGWKANLPSNGYSPGGVEQRHRIFVLLYAAKRWLADADQVGLFNPINFSTGSNQKAGLRCLEAI